jgi:glutathione synthase
MAVIMDPIAEIDPAKDSTFAILLEAQQRNWQVWYGELADLWLRDGQAFGQLRPLGVIDDAKSWYELGDVGEAPLGAMDVILMRKDPPCDMDYLYATYILDRAEARGAIVVNRPQSLRDANEKAFISWFPRCVPPTLISRCLDRLRDFIDEHGCAVVKPLNQMPGRSVFVTGTQDPNRNVVLETTTNCGTKYVMAQMYIPDIVDSGVARILLIDGTPIPHALVRIPAANDHRGSCSVGASIHCRPLTHAEQHICDQVGPVLRDKGLLFAGIDVIGEYLTEINVTSPTGIRDLDRHCKLKIAGQLLECIETHVHNVKTNDVPQNR